jgi:hypothetical protein
MAQILTREAIIQFLLGFIIGKLIGTIVSSAPFVEFLFEEGASNIFYVEFVNNLLSFNGYHYALAIICGLILVIWQSKGIFD